MRLAVVDNIAYYSCPRMRKLPSHDFGKPESWLSSVKLFSLLSQRRLSVLGQVIIICVAFPGLRTGPLSTAQTTARARRCSPRPRRRHPRPPSPLTESKSTKDFIHGH